MSEPSAQARREEEDRLFSLLRDSTTAEDLRQELRNQLIEMHVPLVQHIAHRYADRGEPLDDVVQAGTVGLVTAVDRFDPNHGAAFSSFAVPTIIGAIRRHFRDATWAIKAPRRIQELRGSIDAAQDALAQELGRTPTVSEIAEEAGVDVQNVIDSLELTHIRQPRPLQTQTSDEQPLAERVGKDDPGIATIEDQETVRRMLDSLPDQERQAVILRFFDGLSQSQIATEMDVSQMHVSRLLQRALQRMRSEITQ